MTMQVKDRYLFDGEEYIVIDRTAQEFNPSKYGFSPTYWTTACWAGFWCKYNISDNRLLLHELTILDENDFYPKLNGVAIDPGHYEFLPRHYRDVGMPLPYTGRVLVGKENIIERDLFPWYPHSYKKLIEFVFGAGLLLAVIDHSHAAELVRDEIRKVYQNDDQNRGPGIRCYVEEVPLYKRLPEKERESLRWYWDPSYKRRYRVYC